MTDSADNHDKPPTLSYAPPPPRRGVFNRRSIRLTAFAVISLSLFAVAFVGVLAVWDYVGSSVAWRSLATLGIVCVTMVAFTVINEVFGENAER